MGLVKDMPTHTRGDGRSENAVRHALAHAAAARCGAGIAVHAPCRGISATMTPRPAKAE